MYDNNYCVYIHQNKYNGKVYIGCTKKKLSERFDNGNGYKKCKRFWEDIQKIGFDNFDHYVILDGMSKDIAYKFEEIMVELLDSMNPERGYNMRRGGKHNTPCAEVCESISKAKMGHEVSEETRAKLRNYGKKPVKQISLDGKFVALHPSLTEAAHSVGAAKENIYAVCAGKKPTARGYKWEYYTEKAVKQ